MTLISCAMVCFLHVIDALDWGIALSLRLWTRSIPLFCFGFSGITLGIDIFFYFRFSGIVPGFDPLVFFQVL